MSISERFKEALKNEAHKQPAKKPVKISGKFKLLLKSQNEIVRQANRTNEQKKTKLPGRMRRYSDKKLLRILKAEAINLNRTPTSTHFQNSKDLPSPIVYMNRWGSWNNAIRAAGLEPNLIVRRRSNREKHTNLPNGIPTTGSSKFIPKFQKIELYATLSDQEVEGGRAVIEFGTQLGLDVASINEAVDLYKKIVENELQRGRVKESLASATIYLICRKRKKTISLNEIAQTAGISSKLLWRTAKAIEKKSKLEISPLRPLDLFDGIAKQLKLEEDVKTSAKAILRSSITKRFSIGMNPRSIVAAAIYIAGLTCGNTVTQEEIAKVADITTVTIRNRYQALAQKLGIDLTQYVSPHYITLMKLSRHQRC